MGRDWENVEIRFLFGELVEANFL